MNEKYASVWGVPNQTVGPDGIPGPDGTPDGQGAFAWNGSAGIYAHRMWRDSTSIRVALVTAPSHSWAQHGYELGKGYPNEDEHTADSWDRYYGCWSGDRAQSFSYVGSNTTGWLACWNSWTGVRWYSWSTPQ